MCNSKDILPKWSFFLGDNAFPAAHHVVVPDKDFANFDNFNFEQSSNRMPIECAFVILVNKWAMSWHPLNVSFHRRVPLANSCFHLHDFCIENRMFKEEQLMSQNEHVKVQPAFRNVGAVWSKKPMFIRIAVQ